MVNRKIEVDMSLNPSVSFTHLFTEISKHKIGFLRYLSGPVPNTHIRSILTFNL